MFKAEPLTPSIGAVISGVSLNHLDSENLDQIYDSLIKHCLLYTSPSPRDRTRSRMPSSA